METYSQGLSVDGKDVVRVWEEERPSERLQHQSETELRCKNKCYIADKAKFRSGAGSHMGLESLGPSDTFNKPQWWAFPFGFAYFNYITLLLLFTLYWNDFMHETVYIPPAF